MPNPQDALPLPPRPNLEQYKKLAKDLVKACKSEDADAVEDWIEKWVRSVYKLAALKENEQGILHRVRQLEQIARKHLSESRGRGCALTGAQFVLARAHGFQSWPRFARHLEELAHHNSGVARYEAAADAIVSGDIARVKQLLREDPALVRARSTREHRATLLHYVSANGVEGYRQRTPKNIVEIAKVLLDAGAEVDATCDVYGGGATTLGLVATSAHPNKARVQLELLQLLLDRGASIESPAAGGNKHRAVFAALANGQPEAARFLADRGAELDLRSAASLGHLDVVKKYLEANGRLRQDAQATQAFLYACAYAGEEMIEYLLRQGADIAGHTGDGQTGLHYACIFGRADNVRVLLKHHPPLEAKNVYGGTVLGQTLWSAAHGGDPQTYTEIIEALLAAGAELEDKHPPVNPQIDALLERYGSHPEPSWYWFGEKPRRAKPQ